MLSCLPGDRELVFLEDYFKNSLFDVLLKAWSRSPNIAISFRAHWN
jgi:hypothetical protein